jgi:hypothetical protein
MPVVAEVVPGKVTAVDPLTKGEKVDGVYVALTRTFEEAAGGLSKFVMNPSGEYLARNISEVPAASLVIVAAVVPPVL